MARLYPFHALRYDTSIVRMEDVVTQPYDKISPEMQQQYYEASPYNLIRVILGKRYPSDTDADNCYTRAAEALSSWRREKILKEEAEPALFGYSQVYTVPGTEEVRERRGFIALGHLYDYAEHVVYRHEQTFPKHKSDRLALFKATRAYCEQIYMLYSDPAFTAERLIFGSGSGSASGQDKPGQSANAPDLSIRDEYGVMHHVWKLTDPHLINLILTAMQDKKLIIADGHHRYETSVAYARERSAQLKLPLNQPLDPDEKLPASVLPAPAFPEAAMMMTFVNMDAPGITILPTHRVVFGLDNFSTADFLTRASQYMEVKTLGGPATLSDPAAAAAHAAALGATSGIAFLAVTAEGTFLLESRPTASNEALKHVSPRQRQLDVVHLHGIVLEGLLGLSHESIASLENIRYVRDAREAVEQVAKGQANIAFLTKPVTLDQLRDISLSLEVMPQKSTDFYPKLLSGLAIYALD